MLEAQYAVTGEESQRLPLSAALREVPLLRGSAANKQLLYKSQRVFEQGERTGRMLAWLSKEHTISTQVANVRDNSGRLLTDPGEINSSFASYYADLYSSKVRYSQAELHSYLDSIELPTLFAEAQTCLDAPFTLKEIRSAVESMQAGKTPGKNDLPAEFFKTHSESLVSRLREILQTLCPLCCK